MLKKRIWIVCGIVLAAVVLLGSTAAFRRGARSEGVKTASVVKGNLRSYLSTSAVIKSNQVKNYYASPQLRIKQVYVKAGSMVKRGKTLLDYDTGDLKAAVTQAGLQYDNARLQRKELAAQKNKIDRTIRDLDKQLKELERSTNPSDAVELQALRQQRAALQPISSEKMDLMDNSVRLAKLALDSATSRYNEFRNGIQADFNGTITAVGVTEGMVAAPTQPAFVLQKLDDLKAVVSLGKYDAMKIRTGQDVSLRYGNGIYRGIVTFISPAAARTVSVGGQDTNLQADIDILDAGTQLKVDFDADVDILLGSAENSLKLPVESIKHDKDGKNYVFRVADGKARQTFVKTGIQSDTEVQILEGVSPGEQVILNPGISIKDGIPVRTEG